MDSKVIYAILPLRDGASLDSLRLHVPPAFEVELGATPQLPRHLDWTFAGRTVPIGSQSLVVFGPALEWLPHVVPSDILKVVLESPNVGKSLSADRLSEVNALVLALCPVASVVIQPLARYVASPVADFERDAARFLAANNPSPLWIYPKVNKGPEAAFLETTGMATVGLPDIAFPIDASNPDPHVDVAYALGRAMVDAGPFPLATVVQTSIGELTVDANLHHTLWFVPTDGTRDASGPGRARAHWARRRAFAELIGPHAHFHFSRKDAVVAMEHFVCASGESFAVTNGLSDRAQPLGSADQRNERVELVIRCPQLTPHANAWLDWAAKAIQGQGADDPVGEFHRLLLPEPQQGIAGVLVWPFGHLLPDASRAPTFLWSLLPLTSDEIAHLGRGPEALAAWIQERAGRRDIETTYERRWDDLLAN